MLRNPMETIFRTPSHISVLRVLFQLKDGISGRETARRAGINDRTARLALQHLELLNLVYFRGSSRTRLYFLNRKHMFHQLFLKPLFSGEGKYINEIIGELKKGLKGKCTWAGIFGSVALRKDTSESDLDVLILVNNLKEKDVISEWIPSFTGKLHTRYGITLVPIVFTVGQWEKNKEYRELKDSVRKAFIPLIGPDSFPV